MDARETALSAIEAYKRLSPLVATAGQPAADQFVLVRDAGFVLVINLATDKSSGHLPDEPEIVRRLGMEHIHLPVAWDNPKREDFEAFCRIMEQNSGRAVFVHCAKNWRVSVFMYLYRVPRQQADHESCLWDVREIWEPDPVWSAFMRAMAEVGK